MAASADQQLCCCQTQYSSVLSACCRPGIGENPTSQGPFRVVKNGIPFRVSGYPRRGRIPIGHRPVWGAYFYVILTYVSIANLSNVRLLFLPRLTGQGGQQEMREAGSRWRRDLHTFSFVQYPYDVVTQHTTQKP